MHRLAYRLALRMGQPNVNKMLRNLTAKQLVEWKQYNELEPFDEVRADIRAAQIVQALINVNRGRNQRAVTIKDVLLKFGEDVESRQPQSLDEKMRIMALILKAQALAASEASAKLAAAAKTTTTTETSTAEESALAAARKAMAS